MKINLSEQEFLCKSENKCCLVVGDIILDRYTYGSVERISPEAPIPVIKAEKQDFVLGGAANVAGNIRGYHIHTYICGILGNDENADAVKRMLNENGIEYIGCCSMYRCTTVKTRIIGMNQQLVRIDQEDSKEVNEIEEKELLRNIKAIISQVGIVVLSDYNKGVCSDSLAKNLIDLCNKRNIRIIVDPKCYNWTKYIGSYMITPNFKEFQEAVGKKCNNIEDDIEKGAKELLEKYKMKRILITRSQYGMTLVKDKCPTITFSSVQQEIFDVSGAGDTVIATIAAFLVSGYSDEEAIEIANTAAGLAVSKAGTCFVTLESVIKYANSKDLQFKDKIINKEMLHSLLHSWKNKKIVFTNGCFDILHNGHIEYLNEAKLLGDKLIVGINTDRSVKRLKGYQRPINNQEDRAVLMAALQCVDAVILFDEDTPEDLIRFIKPDILVKGGDYKENEIIGRDIVGKVMVIPLKSGYSTTCVIDKIAHL